MTWFDRHTEDLAEQSEPSEALHALRQLDLLTPEQVRALDVYLTHWVLVVLLRPQDREGILEVQDLCGLARVLAARAPQSDLFLTRWKAFGDLLEGKRHAMHVNDVEVPIKLLHEDAILARVKQVPCKQSDLVDMLHLSAGRVSQLLGVLEAQGKIVRQRKGKESWVSLPSVPRSGTLSAQTRTGNLTYSFFSTHQHPA